MVRCVFLVLVFVGTAACGGNVLFGAAAEPTPSLVLPPLANAGPDLEILRGFPHRLQGIGTFHPARRFFDVEWQQVAGEPVSLSNATELSPGFVAPLQEQTLTFRLSVDDGEWVTTDDVSLHISAQPRGHRIGVRAGPDRFLHAGEDAAPKDEDFADATPQEAELLWRQVRPTASVGSKEADMDSLAATIFALTARHDWDSAPDYLLLFPNEDGAAGGQAPVASVDAPGVTLPGHSLTLDASGSSDANGDQVSFRWEQTAGAQLLKERATDAVIELIAPTVPQQIALRVYVSDGLLESAPVEASIVVTAGENVDTPEVAPHPTLRAHRNNRVWLDALGGLVPQEGADPLTFTWEQTLGPEVALTQDSTRYATFSAATVLDALHVSYFSDEAPIDLAFAVVAQSHGVESAPSVTQVTLLPETDNMPPTAMLCASTLTPEPGETVIVGAAIRDAEADPLGEIGWLLSPETVDLRPASSASQGAIPDPPCLSGADLDPSAEHDTKLRMSFVAPSNSTPVKVTLSACDTLEACGSHTLQLEVVYP